MELLAPAGNREAMVAAVQNGADAVYLGFTAFGARSYAGNFDADGLREAVEYCHERGRRLYVTVNTLIKQQELPALYDVFALLCKMGADAAIVQDLGAVSLARACFPELPLHASTQMTLHNAQGARFALSQGIARAVPARECPLGELAEMARTGIEVEAFVHGALCVSVSGQCLFSSMVGGRSGNRGKCAQPCRLPYRAHGGPNYPLSMRDLLLADDLPALMAAGVVSLKIEGRMKRPEYVALVVATYRRLLDAAQSEASYTLNAAERDALLQVFHRGGGTRGHAFGVQHAELIDDTRPNHGGLEMGRIEAVRNGLAVMRPLRTLHDGDGLQVRGAREAEFTYAGPEVAAHARALLRIPFAVQVADAIYRLTDAEQMRQARQSWSKEQRRIPVDAVLAAHPGKPATLTVSDGAHRVTASTGVPVEPASRHALDEISARKQMEKMGDTPYALRTLTVDTAQAFLPVSALNTLRRDALQALRKERLACPARRISAYRETTLSGPESEELRLIAQTPYLAHAGPLRAAGAQAVYWMPDDYRITVLERALQDGNADATGCYFVLPQLAWGAELERLAAFVGVHAAFFGGVVWSNPGHCTLDFGVLPRVAGAPMNVFNSRSAALLAAQGCVRATLSPELNEAEIAEVQAHGGAWELEVYGRAQLMLLSHCPQKVQEGCAAIDCASCGELADALAPLVDRKGYTFPLRRQRLAHGCQVRVLNSLPTDLLEKHARSLQRQPHLAWRLCFTGEPLAECERLTHRAWAVQQDRSTAEKLPYATTGGHFARGVE